MIARGSSVGKLVAARSLSAKFGRAKKEQTTESPVAPGVTSSTTSNKAVVKGSIVTDVNKFTKILVRHFQDKADTDRAFEMKRYMREQFDYYGLPNPVRTSAFSDAFTEAKLDTAPISKEFVHEFARVCMESKYREMHYSWLSVLNAKQAKHVLSEDLLPLLEKYNIFGKWWDITDSLAGLFGQIFLQDPKL